MTTRLKNALKGAISLPGIGLATVCLLGLVVVAVVRWRGGL